MALSPSSVVVHVHIDQVFHNRWIVRNVTTVHMEADIDPTATDILVVGDREDDDDMVL